MRNAKAAAAKIAMIGALALSAPAGAGWEDPWHPGGREKPRAHGEYDYAKVISVSQSWIEREIPRQECSREIVGYRSAERAAERSYGGAVIGAVAGGILGAQVGKGDGRTVAAAVGAATGAMVGDSLGNRHPGSRRAEPIYDTRCRSWSESVREPAGYDVTYRYAGQTRTAHTYRDPGEWLRVRVSVDAAE